jgi:hypothetical protein
LVTHVPPDERELTSNERAIVGKILTAYGDKNLNGQLDDAVVVTGDLPMFLDLEVPIPKAKSSAPDGPLPIQATVRSEDGYDYGEILVWVRDGVLVGIEHPWWTDERPESWPLSERVKI